MRFTTGLLLILVCTSASAGVYKWTDDQGKVHYSDVPPNTQPTEKVGITKTTGVEVPVRDESTRERKSQVTAIGPARDACKSLLSSASLKELRANGCSIEQAGCTALREYLAEIEQPVGRLGRRSTDAGTRLSEAAADLVRAKMQAKGC